MKAARIVFAGIAAMALTAGWATSSFACDNDTAAKADGKRMKSMAITASTEGGSCGVKSTAATAVTASTEAADHCAAKKAGVQYYFIEDESDAVSEQIPQSLRFLEQVKW